MEDNCAYLIPSSTLWNAYNFYNENIETDEKWLKGLYLKLETEAFS